MPSSRKNSRQKLIDAALDLFLSQGITHTATRQIANLAEVNEATLFRNFGNKYGLLQAVIQEPILLKGFEKELKSHLQDEDSLTLRDYSLAFLSVFEKQQAFLCSLIGEADNYSEDLKKDFTQALQAANRALTTLVPQQTWPLPDESSMALLHGLLLSYAVLRYASQLPAPWSSPESVVDLVVRLFSESDRAPVHALPDQPIQDIPASTVHGLMQQAKKTGAREYAITYLLFGAGLSPEEICRLRKSDRIADSQQHIVTVRGNDKLRQVPVNQWILGKRYGSYGNNPVSRWLKTRKDESEFLLVTEMGLALTVNDIEQSWRDLCQKCNCKALLWQCAQTWQIEMLMKGVTLENLSILSGLEITALEPLAQRAKEKLALAQALLLDQKKN